MLLPSPFRFGRSVHSPLPDRILGLDSSAGGLPDKTPTFLYADDADDADDADRHGLTPIRDNPPHPLNPRPDCWSVLSGGISS